MTRKSLGYVRTEWTCPNCQTRNPGPQKTCSSCGMPQPDDVQFEQTAQEQIITDEAEIAKAKAGPDIHCYYCGARNPAGAATCSQCGGDLTEGTAREKGQLMGAHRDKPAPKIICEACGTENEPDAAKCAQCGSPLNRPQPEPPKKVRPAPPIKKPLLSGAVIGIIFALFCVAGLVFLFLSWRTEDVNGTVNSVHWARSIAIEEFQTIDREDWRDEIPTGAIIGTCTEKARGTESRRSGEKREVCGTPYSEDTGSGYAEVVQDCTMEDVYEEVPVYADYCNYTVDEWVKVDEVSLSGSDFDPQWPSVGTLIRGQRQGEKDEDYEVNFSTEDGRYTYSPGSESEFDRYEIGSRWILKVNTFGAVTGTEPAR